MVYTYFWQIYQNSVIQKNGLIIMKLQEKDSKHINGYQKKQNVKYIIFIFYNCRKKYLQFPYFPIKLNLIKSEMADNQAILAVISDDLTDPNSAKTQNVYLIHVEHITSYLIEVNYFQNIVTLKKPNG